LQGTAREIQLGGKLMSLSTDVKNEIITKFGKDESDTGSTEVQVALLTHRIRELTEHAKKHKKDKHSQHGLVKLVAQRKKMMKYLRRTNPESYLHVVKELTIRG
jgi:small subunit ribosomal protein S15